MDWLKQEVDDDLDVCILNLLPEVSILLSSVAVGFEKVEI